MSPKTMTLLVKIVASFIEAAVAFRIILRFLGANPKSPFAAWIYDLSHPYIYPFGSMFVSSKVGAQAVLDTTALFALAVYLFLAYFVTRLIQFVYSYQEDVTKDMDAYLQRKS